MPWNIGFSCNFSLKPINWPVRVCWMWVWFKTSLLLDAPSASQKWCARLHFVASTSFFRPVIFEMIDQQYQFQRINPFNIAYISLWYHLYISYISLVYHWSITFLSLICHFDITYISFLYHLYITYISLLYHCYITFKSLLYHIYIYISLLYHFYITFKSLLTDLY